MAQLQRLLIDSKQFSAGQVLLTTAQQHYLGHVLRLQAGDRFIAMDGQGQGWLAVLTEQAAQAKLLEVIAAQTELPVAVTLLLAMPKTGLDDVIRQVTELGVANLVLVSSSRTLLKPSDQKIDRWRRIAQEASEQSERQFVPEIHAPQSWTAALQTWNAANSTCYLCAARGNPPHLLSRLLPIPLSPLPITLAIGPEGGWTDLEIEQAVAAGYHLVSLGSRILRAVTAPVVALAIVTSVYEAMPLERF